MNMYKLNVLTFFKYQNFKRTRIFTTDFKFFLAKNSEGINT